MSAQKKRDFDKEAATWDENPVRIRLARDVADAIIAAAGSSREMDALDFGCGTGLVTLHLQPHVRTITGVDNSSGMLSVLEEKAKSRGFTNVRTAQVDFERGGRISGNFQLIVSSMALHHVPDTEALLRQLYDRLAPGGLLCMADLDKEDGSFHGDNTGVFHYGFDRQQLKGLFEAAGFRDLHDATAARVVRNGEKGTREFPVFLISGRKP